MTHFVQIVDECNQKAVRFPFSDEVAAKSFASALNAAFNAHRVDAVVGTYRDGEKCPFGFGSAAS